MPTTCVATRKPARRIGIVLAGTGEASIDALRFLVLQMNCLQSAFEFEFLPSCEDKFLEDIEAYDSTIPLKPMDRQALKDEAPEFARRYESFLLSQNKDYKLVEPPPDYFIVVSLARFNDGYYSARQGPVSVIALGDWKSVMAPPSIVEFILTLILREALAAVFSQLRGSQHLGTKGCICDFTPSLDEVRLKVLTGFICSHCSRALVSEGYPELQAQLNQVLRKKWLGRIDEPDSPAAVAAKLGYNLFFTKGLTPTRWEKVLTTLHEEGVKEFIKVVGGVVLAALLLWFGIKKAT